MSDKPLDILGATLDYTYVCESRDSSVGKAKCHQYWEMFQNLDFRKASWSVYRPYKSDFNSLPCNGCNRLILSLYPLRATILDKLRLLNCNFKAQIYVYSESSINTAYKLHDVMKIKPLNWKGTINQNVFMFRYKPIEISISDIYILKNCF
jgi:hypothetical protein